MPGGDCSELIDPFALSAADGYAWLKGNLRSYTTRSDGHLLPQQRADAVAAHPGQIRSISPLAEGMRTVGLLARTDRDAAFCRAWPSRPYEPLETV